MNQRVSIKEFQDPCKRGKRNWPIVRVSNYSFLFWIELIILLEDDYAIDIKIGDVPSYDGKSTLQLFLEILETFFSLKAKSFQKSQY